MQTKRHFLAGDFAGALGNSFRCPFNKSTSSDALRVCGLQFDACRVHIHSTWSDINTYKKE